MSWMFQNYTQGDIILKDTYKRWMLLPLCHSFIHSFILQMYSVPLASNSLILGTEDAGLIKTDKMPSFTEPVFPSEETEFMHYR